MTTLFIDYEGGNDNYGGTSFALLASGTDGRITSTTFSSATASFPNDGSLIGHYVTIWNGTIYAAYRISAWVSGTELTIAAISGGTALANQAVDRQYYIGGRWKTLTSGRTAVRIVAGDETRMMASKEPTSIGNAKWSDWFSDGTRPYTTVAIASSTNSSPIEITTSTPHNLVDGDFVNINAHTTNTFANGIWKITWVSATKFTLNGSTGNGVGGASGTALYFSNRIVELATPCTAKIADCSLQEGAWTASANVTTSVNTTSYKAQYGSAEIAIGASFTTGKAAYFATGTLDLSGYQQLSLTLIQTAGTVLADSDITIKLCSDTIGDTAVNTINLKSPKALNVWSTFTIDTGGALGASIQSVALYVNTDSGAQTIRIGQLVGVKAASADDSLSLTSLIGKSSESSIHGWWPIMSIRGSIVLLDSYYPSTSIANETSNASPKGYVGTSESAAATLKREPIVQDVVASGAQTQFITQEAGTQAAPHTISGGWNRTDMSTQTGQTWFDSVNSNVTAMYVQSAWTNVDNFFFVRCLVGMSLSASAFGAHGTLGGAGCVTAAVQLSYSPSTTVEEVFARSANAVNFASVADNSTVNALTCYGGVPAILFNAGRCTVKNFDMKLSHYGLVNKVGAGIDYMINGEINQGATTYGAIRPSYGEIICVNVDVTGGLAYDAASAANLDTRAYFHKYGQTANDHRILMESGQIVTDATMPYDGTTAYSWKMSPTSATLYTATFPMYMKLKAVALAANVSKTISFKMRRSNTGLTMKLVCKGGQIAGIASDVSTSMTYAADLWESVSITLTPTETGVVELEAHAYGGATYNGWVSKMEIA